MKKSKNFIYRIVRKIWFCFVSLYWYLYFLNTKLFLLEFTSFFLGNVIDQRLFASVRRSKKEDKSSKTNFSTFRKLVALILRWKCAKGLSVRKASKKSNLKESGGHIEPRNCFQIQLFTKYLRKTLVFVWNSALWDKFDWCFPRGFYQFWQNSIFWSRTEHYAIIPWTFEIFLVFPIFLKS